jgi:hypothetical protein
MEASRHGRYDEAKRAAMVKLIGHERGLRPHHPTAITPRHYVICRTAPSDPADPAAWPAPLATGTGRDRTR